MNNRPSLADRILDNAIALAEHTSWEKLSLYQIAQRLDITLDELHQYYTVKDELVEAWYDRADTAMLQATETAEFQSLDYRERLHTLIMAWLDFLAPHKVVSRDMLLYKLEPAHIHLQMLSILRISRTVQWLREAAQMDSSHVQRIAEEVGLTNIFIKTFVYWMFDHSDRQLRTRKYLDRKLARAEKFALRFFRYTSARPPTSVPITEPETGEPEEQTEPSC